MNEISLGTIAEDVLNEIKLLSVQEGTLEQKSYDFLYNLLSLYYFLYIKNLNWKTDIVKNRIYNIKKNLTYLFSEYKKTKLKSIKIEILLLIFLRKLIEEKNPDLKIIEENELNIDETFFIKFDETIENNLIQLLGSLSFPDYYNRNREAKLSSFIEINFFEQLENVFKTISDDILEDTDLRRFLEISNLAISNFIVEELDKILEKEVNYFYNTLFSRKKESNNTIIYAFEKSLVNYETLEITIWKKFKILLNIFLRSSNKFDFDMQLIELIRYNKTLGDSLIQFYYDKTMDHRKNIIDDKIYPSLRYELECTLRIFFLSESIILLLYLQLFLNNKYRRISNFIKKAILVEYLNMIYYIFTLYIFMHYILNWIQNKEKDYLWKLIKKIYEKKRYVLRYFLIYFIIEAFQKNGSPVKQIIINEIMKSHLSEEKVLLNELLLDGIMYIYEIFKEISINMFFSYIIELLNTKNIFSELLYELKEMLLSLFLRVLLFGIINYKKEKSNNENKSSDSDFCSGITLVIAIINMITIFIDTNREERLLIDRVLRKPEISACCLMKLRLIIHNLKNRLHIIR